MLHSGKKRSRSDLPQSITDADYADDIALLANTPVQAEFLQHSLERVTGGTGLHVNSDKAEYMCFNQRSDISSLNGLSLKLVDEFTYQWSSISSTENGINTRLAKAWIAIDRLSVIWKIDMPDKIKFNFSKLQSYRYGYMDAPHGH